MLIGLILVVCVIVAEATVNNKCVSGRDCDSDECCLTMVALKGRRQIRSATCQKLGTEKVNTDCYVKNRLSSSVSEYRNRCPCDSNHYCAPSGFIEIPQGETGKCVRQIQLKGKRQHTRSCHYGSDCANDECCVSNMRPLGKRQASGHCEKLGTRHSSCLMRNAKMSGQPADQVFQCPCSLGLTCTGGYHQYDMPLGEIGKCQ